MLCALRISALVLVTLAVSGAVVAQDATPLVVGVSETPPFAISGSDGTWDGLGVHLAREAALVMGREVEFRELDRDSALALLGRGDVDALAVVLASPEAERVADLTPAYYAAPLGTAGPPASGLLDVVKRLFSPTFLWIALGLSMLLLLVGLAAWGLERDQDDDEGFNQDKTGIWDGFWWAGVTMSTIGYGDLVPKSVGGRILALVWMVVSMGVTAALTAAVVSALGVGGSGSLRLPDDLREKRVGVVAGSHAEASLQSASLELTPMPSVAAGLDAIEADALDLFVDSAPVLRSATGGRGLDLRVESSALRPQRWALAVAEGSALREPLARAVLDRTGGPDWRAAVERFIPEP